MQVALEVLKGARDCDAAAFNQIVLTYRKKVLGTVARMIGHPEDAEDVAQEVFTRLYFTIQKLRVPELFEVWLHRMTVNAAYDYLRGRHGRHVRHESRMSDLSESQLLFADALAGRRADWEARDQQRIRDAVEELLAGVSDADRIILVLKEMEGLSIRDLEEIYRMSQAALKVRLFRARQRVLKAFREQQAVKRTHALPRTAMARAS